MLSRLFNRFAGIKIYKIKIKGVLRGLVVPGDDGMK